MASRIRPGDRGKHVRAAQSAANGIFKAKKLHTRVKVDGHANPGTLRKVSLAFYLIGGKNRHRRAALRKKRPQLNATLVRWVLRGSAPNKRRARVAKQRTRDFRREVATAKQGKFFPSMLNGHPGNIEPEVERLIAIAVGQFRLWVTSTTDGSSHTSTSHHYPRNNPKRNGKGRGVDLAGTYQAMVDFQRWLVEQKVRQLIELFGPANDLCVKDGQRISIREGSSLEEGHDNHDHAVPTAAF